MKWLKNPKPNQLVGTDKGRVKTCSQGEKDRTLQSFCVTPHKRCHPG